MENIIVNASEQVETSQSCQGKGLAINDALEVLSGRWRLAIIHTMLNEPRRFKQISKLLNSITDKMLSKELKGLEVNKLIQRKVYNTFPPMVEYSITDHGRSLKDLIIELDKWGTQHRKVIIGDRK